jgi:hypothetical protein
MRRNWNIQDCDLACGSVLACLLLLLLYYYDRLCGLVVRVLDYRSGGSGSIPGTTRFSGGLEVVGLERGPLSLVSTTEALLDRKVAAPAYKTENTAVGTRHSDHVALFIRKSWPSPRSGCRFVGIVRSRTQTMEFVCLYLYYYCKLRL